MHDIKDPYVNIPIDETITITKSMLLKDKDAQITQQIITLMEIIYHRTTLHSRMRYINLKM
jgi:hypothetical protein